ncbi:VOC family protein [Arthrobacter sulfonylureivorans]|uniref:VOC family protein n=1 Tax=Arthrobacter sulfonylureivorans TaxID=2486855 RepID=A0ABY3WFK4_9MICC|nr:VOC family protein [Arthrobacter sulfonylureivorans]UNK47117.1 VOC family protein [Arthrobacter sulfonylureivorans]
MTLTNIGTLSLQSINHYAIATKDMEATHAFWTGVMGCEFKAALRGDEHQMSTGEVAPEYLHAFYSFKDGSCIAFFELASGIEPVDDGVPSWTKHLALAVDSHEELRAWHRHLKESGVVVAGEVDHDGLFYSLYLFDPNGQRVEITYQTRQLNDEDRRQGFETMEAWVADKHAGKLG